MKDFEITEPRKRSELGKKIIYQVFFRSFTPEGTVRAAAEKLEHIASLGVDIVYVTSCCEADDDNNKEYWSPRQHESGIDNPRNPYRIMDYERIDPEYGTAEDFKAFVVRAHSLGLSVMFDLVYLHCGPGKFPERYPDFVCREEDGSVKYNSYHFPILNFSNPELREYLWDNMLYWVREFDIDGYRCDVGDAIPLDFWREGRRRVDAIKPNFIMLNEGERADYLVDVFDADYDFVWMRALRNAAYGKSDVHALRFAAGGVKAKHPDGALVLRSYENHDFASDSYENRLDKVAYSQTEAALVINFTIDGIPFLYNGNEIADFTRHSLWSLPSDPFRIDWTRLQSEDGQRRVKLVRRLCELRHKEKALYKGETEWHKHSRLAVFCRTAGNERIWVAANLGKEDSEIALPGGELVLRNLVKKDGKKLCVSGGGYAVVKTRL